MANVHTQSLLSEVAELWRTGEGSDLTIKCEGREFKVHKLIVSAASPTLKAACQNGMLESETGVIEHKTFDADTVERMLEFIYTRDYLIPRESALIARAIDTSESKHETDEVTITGVMARWILHTRMFAISDYYDLPTLKALALVRLQIAAADTFELRDFVYVVKEANKLIGMHKTNFHNIFQAFCLRNVAALTADKMFMAAIAEDPEMQEFAASLLGQVALHSDARIAALEDRLDNFRERSSVETMYREREREAHRHAMQDLQSQMDHYQAVIERLMDDVGKLPLRCPNIRCGSTNKAPWKLQRQAHADYGAGTGFVEIQCGRCRHKLSK